MENQTDKIEKRLQLLFASYLFFPIIIEAIFKLVNASENMLQTNILSWVAISGFFLLTYVFFDYFQNKFNEKVLKLMNILTQVNLVALAGALISLGLLSSATSTTASILKFAYAASLALVAFLPLIFVTAFLIYIAYLIYLPTWKSIKVTLKK